MARAGVSVDESVDCIGIGSGEATDRLLSLAAQEYKAVNVGAQRFQFARTYRPTWAIVLGILLLPVLVGALFFLIKSTETWTVTVEEDHRRVRIRINGHVLPQTLLSVREAMTSGPAPFTATPSAGLVADPVQTPTGVVAPPTSPQQVVSAQQGQQAGFGPPPEGMPLPEGAPVGAFPAPQGAPVGGLSQPMGQPLDLLPPPSGSPSQVSSPSPVAPQMPQTASPRISLPEVASPGVRSSSAPVSIPAPPATGPSKLAPKTFGNPTPASSSSSPETTPRKPVSAKATAGQLNFDTGLQVPVEPFMLIGRDPEPAAGEPRAALVPIDDVDLTVSKTHLSLKITNGQIWVTDRGSTNGSALLGAKGQVTPLEPGTETLVHADNTVRFGARSFVVAGVNK